MTRQIEKTDVILHAEASIAGAGVGHGACTAVAGRQRAAADS